MWPKHYQREHEFLDMVACSIVSVLSQCRTHRSLRSTDWVLKTLESNIDRSIKILLN